MKYLRRSKTGIFRLLSKLWFMPFGYYIGPYAMSGIRPKIFSPRSFPDLIANKMAFPDNPNRAIVADKLAVRGWVSDRIGSAYLVPLYDVCESLSDLDIGAYTFPIVVKASHGSGWNVFVHNISDCLDITEKAEEWLGSEFNTNLEWVYRDIKPRLLVEKLLQTKDGEIPPDLHVHCFFGEPVLLTITTDRHGALYKYFLSPEWDLLPVGPVTANRPPTPDKPKRLAEILGLARKLSGEFDYIRIDFLLCDEAVYFSEMTNFHLAGAFGHTPRSFDVELYKEYKRRKKEYIAREREAYAAKAKITRDT